MRETMDSVLAQSLSDIEIIAVDAGSTDGTFELLEAYAHKDARLRVLRSDKKSMGYQYNLGMDAASAEYIGFVESDDYVDYGMYERLYEAITEYEVDYVKTCFDMFIDLYGGRLFLPYSPVPKNRHIYGKIIDGAELDGFVMSDAYMWNGLYRKTFIQGNNIRANETAGAAFQDMGFILQTMLYAEKVMYINQPSYRYRKDNENSSSYSRNACGFILDELMYVYPILRAKKSDTSLLAQRTLDKCFIMFSHYFGEKLSRVMYDEDSEEKAKAFRKFLLDSYGTLGNTQRIWCDFDGSPAWFLFVNKFDTYCSFIKESAMNKTDMRLRFARTCAEQKIIIFGCGDMGSRVYCYLRRCGLNICGFCDNNGSRYGTTYMNQPVFSPQEAIERYGEALYVVAVAENSHAENMRRQLICAGVEVKKICRSPMMDPYTVFEVPVA
jgi:glycosyltransferase involved in cell wall biosynthesis